MTVKDCMNSHVIAVDPEDSAAVAARLMARHNLGALPVAAYDGSLCGMITDRDLILRCMAVDRPAEGTTVGTLMTSHVASVPPTASLSQAAACMAREQVRRLPVVEGRRMVGMVSLGDLSRQAESTREAERAFTEITANIHRLD